MKIDLVYKITSSIPKGKVATYGQIANLAGLKSPRQVGKMLHQNPDPDKIPCHRVVNTAGKVAESFAFGGKEGRISKLTQENIKVKNGKVDLKLYQWC